MLAFEYDQQVQTARGRSVHARWLLQLHASHDSLAGGLLSLLPQGPVCRHSSHSLLAGATPAKRESVTWVLAEMGVATLLLLATSRLQTPKVTPVTPTAPAPVAVEAEAEAVMIVVTIAVTVATAMTAMTAVVTTMIVMTMTVAVMIAVMIAIVAVMTATVVTTATAENLIEILTETLIITTMIVMSAETAATSPATIASAAPVRRWTSPRLRRLLQFLRRIAVFVLHTNSVTCKLG